MFNKDFGKSVSDFFGKGYPTTQKVTFDIAAPGSQYRAVAEGEVRSDNTVATSFAPVWSDGKNEVKVDFKNTGAVATALTFRPAAGVVTTATLGLGAKKNLNVGVDYTAKQATFSSTLRFPTLQAAPSVEAGVVVRKDKCAGGVIGSVKPDSKQLEYATVNFEFRDTISSSRYILNAAATYYGPGKTQGVLGLAYLYSFRYSFFSQILVNNGRDLVAALGVSRLIDSGTLAKVAFRSTGHASVSVAKDISEKVNLTVGTEVNVLDSTHRSGFTINIKA